MSSNNRLCVARQGNNEILERYVRNSDFVFRWMRGNEPELEADLDRSNPNEVARWFFERYQNDGIVRDVTEMYAMTRQFVLNLEAEHVELPDSLNSSLFGEVEIRPELERANRIVVDMRMRNGIVVDLGDENFIRRDDVAPLYEEAQAALRELVDRDHAKFMEYRLILNFINFVCNSYNLA